MKATVLISTRDRAAALEKCIESFASLKASWSWELVIVDNGSSDTTEDTCRRAAARFSFPIRYVLERKLGLSAGRNAGLRVAKGEYIAITDDDVIVDPNWLEEIVSAFDQQPDIGFQGGRLLLGSEDLQRVAILTDTVARRLDQPRDAWLPYGANMASKPKNETVFGDGIQVAARLQSRNLWS